MTIHDDCSKRISWDLSKASRDSSVKTAFDASSLTTLSFFERSLLLFGSSGRVHFSESANTIREIETLDEYSEEEFEASFYCKYDFNRLENERNEAATKMEKGILAPEDDDFDCCLESSADKRLRRKLYSESVAAVMAEQEAQWTEEVTDEKKLAEAYREFSFASHLDAHERALDLENGIQDYGYPGRWSSAIRKSKKRLRPEKRSSVLREDLKLSITSLFIAGETISKLSSLTLEQPQSPVVEKLTGHWRRRMSGAPPKPVREDSLASISEDSISSNGSLLQSSVASESRPPKMPTRSPPSPFFARLTASGSWRKIHVLTNPLVNEESLSSTSSVSSAPPPSVKPERHPASPRGMQLTSSGSWRQSLGLTNHLAREGSQSSIPSLSSTGTGSSNSSNLPLQQPPRSPFLTRISEAWNRTGSVAPRLPAREDSISSIPTLSSVGSKSSPPMMPELPLPVSPVATKLPCSSAPWNLNLAETCTL